MNPPEQENVFTLLLKSATNNNGRSLQPSQVREVIDTIRAVQFEMAEMHIRTEQLTRFCVVLIDLLDGDLTIDADFYVEAERKGLTADWNEEGTEIALSTYEVDMPEVRDDDGADDDGELASVSSLSDARHAPLTVEGSAADTDAPVDTDSA